MAMIGKVLRAESNRRPDLRLPSSRVKTKREIKSSRHDAHDFVRHGVEQDFAADDVGCGIEAPLPKLRAEDDNFCRFGLVVLRRECAA